MTPKTPVEPPPKPKAKFCGKPGRSGAKPGIPQRNGASVATTLARLPLGEFPLALRRLTREARKYKRHLEGLQPLAKADISDLLVQDELAHEADLAASAEGAKSVALWLLRNRFKDMSTADILKCNEVILKCKSMRNEAATRYRKRLGVDVPPPSPWLVEVKAEPDAATELEDK